MTRMGWGGGSGIACREELCAGRPPPRAAQENIGPSSLHFRVGVKEPGYSQGADWLVPALYGIEGDASLVQVRPPILVAAARGTRMGCSLGAPEGESLVQVYPPW